MTTFYHSRGSQSYSSRGGGLSANFIPNQSFQFDEVQAVVPHLPRADVSAPAGGVARDEPGLLAAGGERTGERLGGHSVFFVAEP